MAFLIQWLQITIKLFYADFYELPLDQVYEFPDHIQEAYLLSMAGLLVQCLGIWLVLKKIPLSSKQLYVPVVRKFRIKNITIIYIFVLFVTPFLIKISFASGGFQQIIEKIISLKWSVLYVFYLTIFIKQERKYLFYIIISIEIVLGFTGYFGSFKDYFMFLALGYLTLKDRISVKHYLLILTLGILLFSLAVAWQYVKPEYREFLTSGNNNQLVNVTTKSALEKITTLFFEIDQTAFQKGFERLIDRTSYLDYFSAAISYVPKQFPYEKGKLWRDALVRIFTPRFFFPDKKAIDDTEKVNKYTGLELAGAEQGASITLGYIGESYVDFGKPLMFLPLFLLGLCLGYIYKYILTSSGNILLGSALLIPLFYQLNLFEVALDKLLGGTIAYVLVIIILKNIGTVKLINRYMIKNDPN